MSKQDIIKIGINIWVAKAMIKTKSDNLNKNK